MNSGRGEGPLDDFEPNAEGLRSALDALLHHRGAPGEPHPRHAAMPLSWEPVGLGGSQALDMLATSALANPARLDHPGFLAHMDPPTPWFTWAATQWAAATNQNLLHPDVAPQMRELEDTVVRWLAPSFGMTGGHLVPGSTVANLTALWAARDLAGVTEVVSSSAAHLSIAKSAHILGLPHRTIPAASTQRLEGDDPTLLGDLSSAALVLTAGTAGAGAIDHLGFTAAKERAAWVHVDAAWAGPLRLSETYSSRLDGIERADSVGFSAHKWLHQPKDAGAVLFANAKAAHAALSFGGGYLSAPNVGLLGSSGARALPLAATLLAWGRDGVRAVIDAGMDRITELEALIVASDEFHAFAPHQCGVLLWRPNDPDLDPVEVQQHLENAWVSVAEVDGATWFRSVGANPLARPDQVVDAVRSAIGATRSD